MAQTAFAVAAALIAVALGLALLDRYLARRQPHELAWALAFATFALASLALAIGAHHGWNPFLFRMFYLFGAIINVPILALGSLLLSNRNRPRRAKQWTILISVFVVFSAGVLTVAPFTAPLPREELVRGSEVFAALPRVLAAVGSGVSALVIIVLALRSAVLKLGRNLVWGNIFIALGTLIIGMSGIFNSVFGEMNAFTLSLAIGVAVIFLGFLFATTPPRSTAR